MTESLLILEDIKEINKNVGLWIEKHNKMYWWEILLIISIHGSIILFCSAFAVLLTNILLIDGLLSCSIGIILCLVVTLYLIIDGYDIIKAKILIKFYSVGD